MREILFRGKRVDNGEWIYGSYHKPFEDVEQIVEKTKTNASQMSLVVFGSCGQYTGLTDKNGNKIFEADVVRINEAERNYVIKFHKGCFKLFHADPKLNDMLWGTIERVSELLWSIEIIGDIHEKEVLK